MRWLNLMTLSHRRSKSKTPENRSDVVYSSSCSRHTIAQDPLRILIHRDWSRVNCEIFYFLLWQTTMGMNKRDRPVIFNISTCSEWRHIWRTRCLRIIIVMSRETLCSNGDGRWTWSGHWWHYDDVIISFTLLLHPYPTHTYWLALCALLSTQRETKRN